MSLSTRCCVGWSFPTGKIAEFHRQMTIELLDTCCSNSEVWGNELTVFIIMSPFPSHFPYKLVQVTHWVPSRMAPGNLLRYTCKTHNSARSLWLTSCGFHVLLELQKLTGASGLEGALELISSCFTEKEAEAERGWVCCPWSNRKTEMKGTRVDLGEKQGCNSPW